MYEKVEPQLTDPFNLLIDVAKTKNDMKLKFLLFKRTFLW